ncbi:MAG: SOS response-associated peptidase [Desulfovermiculus sp.]
MCGRFGLWAEPRQIEDHFQVQLHLPVTSRYNISPGEEILAIGQTEDVLRKAAWLHWGLVPHWSKEPGSGHKMINACSESMFDKPAYRSAARKRSCLIPASCFLEWKRRGQGPKQPFCIRPRDTDLFAFAGIWERWEDKEAGYSINSCAIVTTRAIEVVYAYVAA